MHGNLQFIIELDLCEIIERQEVFAAKCEVITTIEEIFVFNNAVFYC